MTDDEQARADAAAGRLRKRIDRIREYCTGKAAKTVAGSNELALADDMEVVLDFAESHNLIEPRLE